MSETKYESSSRSIPASAEQVYKVLSNFNNLERVKDLIPQDKIQEIEIGEDYVCAKVDGLGQKITIRIVDKIENSTIKLGAENIPVGGNFWVQLKEVNPTDTRIKLTLKAELPMMFKMMLDKKIKTGIEQAVEMLTKFPYAQWN